MPGTDITCYSVVVNTDIPNQGDGPTFTIYIVLAENEPAAVEAVAGAIPNQWAIASARRTTLEKATVERLDLRPGHPHRL